jgi:Ca-activated chloride channel family protein
VIFESPRWLFALLTLPIIAAAEVWLTSRDRERLARLVARPLWARVVRRPHERWRWSRLALLLLGAAGVIVALARPQWGIVRERIEREGVDVVLVLDTSGSMATSDVAPSRFFLARQALLQLMTRLEGDRFALIAFEGEAYPLVPLTLDGDAVGLFLETVEPGIVPAPGTSLGVGLAKGLDAFVDEERRNKVMVLVSDGENLEGEVEDAVERAKRAGVIVHTVGVGTEAGQPVPEFDVEGRQTGYKRDASGQPVVSRLNTATLERIASGTGGSFFRLTPSDTSLGALASLIEGMERQALAREWSYRRRERYQGPLAFGLACLAAGLLLPLPRLRRKAAEGARQLAAGLVAATAAAAVLGTGSVAHAQAGPPAPAPPNAPPAPTAAPPPVDVTREGGGALDEILLRPRRLTERGLREYENGNHPEALEAFEGAAQTRPEDPAVRFNMADGLYKNGQYDEAATLFRSLGQDPTAPLAPAARFNLGNSLYQKQDYEGAIRAYRDALRVVPNDEDTRRNLELALRQLKEQEEQRKRQQQQKQDQDQQQKEGSQSQDQRQQQEQQKQEKEGEQQEQRQQQQNGQQTPPPRPQTAEQREDQRFREQAGMPKERAMQLLDALEENEKAEQRRLLAEQRAKRKKGKDW